MAKKPEITFRVSGQEPGEAAAPIFSNFMGIARVGTDVQLEFVFLDLNMLANILQKAKEERPSETLDVGGKTVAKIIMPGAAFVQLREHINRLCDEMQELLPKPEEIENARERASS